MKQLSEPQSRVARDMAAWDRIEGKLIERYGKKIIYDRDFLKAKRDIYKHIRNKYKRRPLNLYEKAEMKVLRGQQRRMLRQLYPNPFVRLTRNALVFTGNLVAFTVRRGTAALKAILSVPPKANASHRPRPPYPSPGHHKQQQATNTDRQPVMKPVPLQKKTNGQTQTITRKMPVKSRTQMPTGKTKGVRL